MAGPDQVLFTHFQFVPELGAFLEPDQPPEQARTLLELSAGKLNLSGQNIVDTQTHRFVGRLSLRRPSSIDVGTDGTILLNNSVERNRLRDVMGTDAIPRAIIRGDLTAFGGAFPAAINRMITLAPQGQVIYVDESKLPGKAAYSRVNMAVFGDAGAPLSNSLGRLITSEQMLIRGVAGWLSRNAPAAIERLKLQGVQMSDGTTSVSGSDIIRAIAANIAVEPVVTYVVRQGSELAHGAA